MADGSGRGQIRRTVADIAWIYSGKTRKICDMIAGSRASIEFQDLPKV